MAVVLDSRECLQKTWGAHKISSAPKPTAVCPKTSGTLIFVNKSFAAEPYKI